MSNPQEVQFGKLPPVNAAVQFGKIPAADETAESAPGETGHNPGIVPDYAGGDPVPADAVSDPADDDSDDGS